ncbi:MAG: hypothetical protein ACSHX6_05660 [Akkermansiaceae bacterium]
MKKTLRSPFYYFAGFAALFTGVACTQINQARAKNGAPTQKMATATNTDLKDLGEGHAIFMRQCSQCHEPKLPATIPSEAWHVIVPGMAWNAGLSEIEEKSVHAYIMAASQYNEQQR